MDSYKKTLISSFLYTALSKYSGLIISIITTAILSRLLTPEDFGIVALATIFITFFSIISDLGIGPAVIQNKELTQNDIQNLFSFTIYLGLFLAFIFYLLAPIVGYYYKQDILINVIKLLSISVFFTTINSIPSALLLSSCKFKFIAIRTLIIQLILAPFSIFAAFYGYGIYSLLIAPILSSIFIFFVNYKVHPIKFYYKLNIKSIEKVKKFSLYQFFFNTVNFFTRNLDKLLIGRFIGMEQLGYFEKSYRLMMLPLQNLTHVITPSFHPIFSKFQNDLSLQRERYFNILKYLGYIAFPLGVYLYYIAEEIILLLFGPQWMLAVTPFKILSISIPTQIIGSTQGSIFQATNKTNIMFYTGLSNSIVYIFILTIALYWGKSINAVASAFVFACYINCWTYNIMCKYVLECKSKRFYALFKKPFILSLIIILTMEALRNINFLSESTIILSFIIKTIIIGGISIIYYHFICGLTIKNIKNSLKAN